MRYIMVRNIYLWRMTFEAFAPVLSGPFVQNVVQINSCGGSTDMWCGTGRGAGRAFHVCCKYRFFSIRSDRQHNI
jgi:hypothetical protein